MEKPETSISYTLVEDTAQIDLTRHALIEASAGTGKTYTLENLVVRLLMERPDLFLENILMVTFTEKATSELKIRIREKLERELALRGTDPAVARKLQEALDTFDAAAIHTIHGFCHTLLTDFAFENGNLFQNEVVDDGPVHDALVREQMRSVWPEAYGKDLPEMLRMAGFGDRKDRFLSLVTDLARRSYRPGIGDRLVPDPGEKTVGQIRSDIAARVMELRGLMEMPPGFSRGFQRLHINARSRSSLMAKIVEPLEAALSRTDEERGSVPALREWLEGARTVRSAGRQGIPCLLPETWLKKGPNPEACPQLEAVVEALEGLAETLDEMAHFLTVDAVRRLRSDAARVKRQNGWISYDDMLARVDAALSGDAGPALIRTLRSRYKIAFVDEFQDTDPVQWRIFRRLFLDPAAGQADHLLFLIGDPKQAIYSFRGADVHAYLEARHAMERLWKTGGAHLYSLAVNWRSEPELVGSFNRLFGAGPWFPSQRKAGPFDIGYEEARSPLASDLPESVAADGSRRRPLNLVDLRGSASHRAAKADLARFVAGEIRYLIADGGIRLRMKNGERRPLDAGDVCVLVRSRSDAVMLEPEFAERGISYAFYKKPGLFFSDEALYLGLVFHAVLDPGNLAHVKTALLTPFFAFGPADLRGIGDLPAAHPLRQVLFRWHDLARNRRWGALFQSLMEDSGLLFRQSVLRDWDRQYANYRQIFEHLEAMAYRKNLDFRALSALLEGYRTQRLGAADDADIHQIETEERKVQIMTMHVSKGLQFPVVFIAGGLTQRFADDCHRFHRFDPDRPDAGSRKVIDLTRRCDPERHRQEKIDEDKRLYYVALTRAQCKLYVPFFPAAGGQSWIGPVCRFVSESVASAFPPDIRTPGVGWLPADAWQGRAADAGLPAAHAQERIGPDAHSPMLPDTPDFRTRRILLESFSSLHARGRRGAPAAPAFQVAPYEAKEDDEGRGFSPEGTSLSVPAADEIPGGPDVGSMFHDIFETIDFAAVAGDPERFGEIPEAAECIGSAMDAYRVDRQWQPRICTMIADVLTAPVGAAGDPFVVGGLGPEDRIHEVAFFYPVHLPGRGETTVAGCRVRGGAGGFVRGFVDLVFRHGGRYFIADWKSNRLDAGYGPDALEACMNDAGYHLQYKLYTVAMLRWLKTALGDRFDPARHFGGVFYFFIRGMGLGNGSGIYHVPPASMGTPERLEAEVARVVADSVGSAVRPPAGDLP